MVSPYGVSSTSVSSALGVDWTHRLEHFKHIFLNWSFEAGFLTIAVADKVDLVMAGIIASWVEKGVYEPNTRRWKRRNYEERPRPPWVDARDLVRGWNDFDWAKDVHLGKICIYNLGIMESFPDGGAWEKQMVEVDSIMLP